MAYVALNIKGLNALKVYARASYIYECLEKESSFFNDLPFSLANMLQLLDELKQFIVKAKGGGTLIILQRNEALKKLKKMLSKLASYVQLKSEGDPSIIIKAGMDVKKTGTYTRKTINTPKGLMFRKGGSSTRPVLQWMSDTNVMNYIEVTLTPDDPESWRRHAFTSKKKIMIQGLKPEKIYWFRVMSITAGAVSDFSYPVKKWIE